MVPESVAKDIQRSRYIDEKDPTIPKGNVHLHDIEREV